MAIPPWTHVPCTRFIIYFKPDATWAHPSQLHCCMYLSSFPSRLRPCDVSVEPPRHTCFSNRSDYFFLATLTPPRLIRVQAVAAFGHPAWLTARKWVMMLSAFPFLTADEFEHACRALANRSCTSATHGGWSSIRLVTQVFPIGTLSTTGIND